ncbi:AAA family ATPase [Methylomonas sp. BW4-1]|uniref:AAA family ATPase n=1 Tax=Methylomonas sp. BW4-1 TaxID=3376685 RepID=UPI004041E3AF
MIERISIDGYKCLKDVDIETGLLNVLVGPNASGKSSVLQAMLLLRQSADKDGKVDNLHLSGLLYEAGTALDVLHPAAEYRIKLQFQNNGENTDLLFFHSDEDRGSQTPIRLLRANNSKQLPIEIYDRENSFAYLNAERIGPRVSYFLPPDELHLGGLVGKHGEYTAAILDRASNDIMIDDGDEMFLTNLADAVNKLDGRDLLRELIDTEGRLDLVCNLMLSWILPGSTFEAKEHDQTDSATLRFIRNPKTKTSVRATHIGFGLTYTLPIITAALALRRNGLLLVENPEAHLHPFSQSRIGVFLAVMAATGRQIFLETHSDHVINGIRLAVKYGFIQPEEVYINFFKPPIDGDSATVIPIRIQENGRLDRWPEGFFDQIEDDLSKL